MANAMLDADPMTDVELGIVRYSVPSGYGPWRQRAWHAGFLTGRAMKTQEARADFERTLVILREENSTLRRMLEAQTARADQLATDLIRGLAVQAPRITTGGPPVTAIRRPTGKDPIAGLGNVLDPVDFGDPNGQFASAAAASLMAAEEDDGLTPAASA